MPLHNINDGFSLKSSLGHPIDSGIAGLIIPATGFTPYYQICHDGDSSVWTVKSNSLVADDDADPLSGTNAVEVKGDGLGAADPTQDNVTVSPANNITWLDGENVLRMTIKTIAKQAAKHWVRFRPQNVTSTGSISFNITDIAVGVTAGWTDKSVTDLGSGFILCKATIDMSGDADLAGRFFLGFGNADGDNSVINDTADENIMTVFDLTLSPT